MELELQKNFFKKVLTSAGWYDILTIEKRKGEQKNEESGTVQEND